MYSLNNTGRPTSIRERAVHQRKRELNSLTETQETNTGIIVGCLTHLKKFHFAECVEMNMNC